MGTPKTLREAIEKGVLNGLVKAGPGELAETTERHVRDFLAQHFTVALISSELASNSAAVATLTSLYERLTGRRIESPKSADKPPGNCL